MEVKDIFGHLPTLQTDRLLLRKLQVDDLQDIFEYACDPKVARYTTWQPHETVEQSRDFLHHVLGLYEKGKVAPWGVEHKNDRKLIGTCGFLDWNLQHARAEIGYALSRRYWGRGLATEAVQAVIAFGFSRMALNRIQGRCEVENVASGRVMEKAGLKFEGLLREHEFSKGAYADISMYAILRKEWTERAPCNSVSWPEPLSDQR